MNQTRQCVWYGWGDSSFCPLSLLLLFSSSQSFANILQSSATASSSSSSISPSVSAPVSLSGSTALTLDNVLVPPPPPPPPSLPNRFPCFVPYVPFPASPAPLPFPPTPSIVPVPPHPSVLNSSPSSTHPLAFSVAPFTPPPLSPWPPGPHPPHLSAAVADPSSPIPPLPVDLLHNVSDDNDDDDDDYQDEEYADADDAVGFGDLSASALSSSAVAHGVSSPCSCRACKEPNSPCPPSPSSSTFSSSSRYTSPRLSVRARAIRAEMTHHQRQQEGQLRRQQAEVEELMHQPRSPMPPSPPRDSHFHRHGHHCHSSPSLAVTAPLALGGRARPAWHEPSLAGLLIVFLWFCFMKNSDSFCFLRISLHHCCFAVLWPGCFMLLLFIVPQILAILVSASRHLTFLRPASLGLVPLLFILRIATIEVSPSHRRPLSRCFSAVQHLLSIVELVLLLFHHRLILLIPLDRQHPHSLSNLVAPRCQQLCVFLFLLHLSHPQAEILSQWHWQHAGTDQHIEPSLWLPRHTGKWRRWSLMIDIDCKKG